MSRWKRLLPPIVMLAIVAVFAFRNADELRRALWLLRSAHVWPLLGALGFQFLYYAFATLTVRQCLRLVDFDLPFTATLKATFLLIFVSRMVPGPAATGPAAMYVVLGRRGLDRTKAAFVGPIFYAVDYGAFFLFLLAGVLIAVLRKEDVRAALASLPIVLLALVLTLWGLRLWNRPERLEKLLSGARGRINGVMAFLHIGFQLPVEGPARVADTVVEMKDRLDRHPGIGIRLVAAGVAMLFCDVITMALSFMAFGFQVSISGALLGFCLATVGAIVSVLPGGLGTFEVAMVLGFEGVGSPRATAVAATVTYRVIATWLPAILGILASGELTHGGKPCAVSEPSACDGK